jgi:endonuclease-3
MQYSFLFEPDSRLSMINARLSATYGPLPACDQLDPVSQLILSMIGARTLGDVSVQVIEELRKRFANWSEIVALSDRALTCCLQPVTYAERKAGQLRHMIRMIERWRGSPDLDFLVPWPVLDAQAWLCLLPGVGTKVSAAVLNFSTLRKRILVVDCHHYRVATRLGFLREKTPFSSAQRILMDQHVPNEWTAEDVDDHHRLIKLHGQTLCFHKGPLCGKCPLQDVCPTGQNGGSVQDPYDGPDKAYGSEERIKRN